MTTSNFTEDQLLDTLKEVIDPELNCNIVDLGLIYGVTCSDGVANVQLTLTTQGCPMHESIAYGVQNALLSLEGINEVNVDLVWEPPWTSDRLSPAARELLGIF
jgi:metal-sulfur cluster biosynthetic enzyme